VRQAAPACRLISTGRVGRPTDVVHRPPHDVLEVKQLSHLKYASEQQLCTRSSAIAEGPHIISRNLATTKHPI